MSITQLEKPVSAEHANGRLRAAEPAALRADLPFLCLFGGLLLLLSSLPYLYGYLSSPEDQRFMGLTYTTHDYAQYMSWARESADGFLVENKLTPERTEPSFFNLFWWLVGRLERYLGLSFVQVNHAARLLSGALFVGVTYAFCATIFRQRARRRFALVLACVTSGFGWALVGLKQVTGELAQPLLVQAIPGNTFFGLMVVPHHVFAAAVHVGIFLLVLQAYRRGCRRRMLAAGLLGLVLGLAHTYDLVTAYVVVAAFGLLVTLRDGLRFRWLQGLALFYGLSAPAPLYWVAVSASSPEWRQVLAQYRNLGVFTPDPLGLVILLGLTFLLAVATFRGFVPLAERRDDELLLGSWLLLNLLLVYLPVNFQIMMLNGYQVGLAVMATRGLFEHILPWLRRGLTPPGPTAAGYQAALARLPAALPALVLLAVLPTNLYLLAWRFVDLSRHDYPDYLHRDDVAALEWLAGQAHRDDVVLSSLALGHYVPGWTGAHGFLAHGAGTLDFYRKRSAVESFFGDATSDAERQTLLREFDVGYVLHGPAERRLGRFDPANASYLEPAFVSDSTRVYRHLPEPGAAAAARSGARP